MNVVSEMVAAARYLALSRHRPEPALGVIAGWLAADEARHGATFFAYARRWLAQSRHLEADRLDALKVLYFWLFESEQVQHPVNLFRDKARGDPALAEAMESMRVEAPRLERRLCAVVGHLIGIPLVGPDDVMPALRTQAQRVRAGHAALPAPISEPSQS